MPIVLRAGSATDVGVVRQINEDQLLIAETVFAVADGMGGHQAGEVASLKAVEVLRGAFSPGGTPHELVSAVEQANRTVYDHAEANPDTRGMGTTLTAVAVVNLDGQEQLAIANVGDSRAYLLRQGELTQLTEDHSLVEELVREGRLTPEEAMVHPQRSIITRALGVGPDVDVDVFPLNPIRGDRVLLCSDGLTNEVTDEQIASTMRRIDDPDELARDLVTQANANGGNDNITVVVVDVVDAPDMALAASAALAADPVVGRPAEVWAPPPAPPDGPPPAPPEPPPPAAAPPEPPPAAAEPKPRRLTARAVAFVLSLLIVLGLALGAVTWYARNTFFVGFDGDRVAIFQGRPGGLLWFDPTLEEQTDLDRDEVPAAAVARLEDGLEESSVEDARELVDRLREQGARERRARGEDEPSQPSTTTTPTTARTTTTR